MILPIDVKELAVYIHNNYEMFSKQENWNTQKECRVDFDKLPEANKKVMCLVATSIINYFALILNSKLSQEFKSKLKGERE